jgi:hypothetical protein
MSKLNKQTTTAEISVSIPILKTLPDNGFSLNTGALTLSLGGRNFILDADNTDFTNPKKKGKNFEFSAKLFVDLDTFEEGKEYNYKLTEEDLKSDKLRAEFYCSDCDVDIEDAFDFEAAEIGCTVYVGEKEYEIKIELEG